MNELLGRCLLKTSTRKKTSAANYVDRQRRFGFLLVGLGQLPLLSAACAAAKRAMGTRNGLQLT